MEEENKNIEYDWASLFDDEDDDDDYDFRESICYDDDAEDNIDLSFLLEKAEKEEIKQRKRLAREKRPGFNVDTRIEELKVSSKREYLSKHLSIYNRSFKCENYQTDNIQDYKKNIKCIYLSHDRGYLNICTMCFLYDGSDERLKSLLLEGKQDILCPACKSKVKKNGTKERKNKRYNGKKLQNYKCLNSRCKHSFVFEKLYDDEIAKEKALFRFFINGQKYYKIAKELGYKYETIVTWVRDWVAEFYPEALRLELNNIK